MKISIKKVCILCCFLVNFIGYAQLYNTNVEARIKLNTESELLEISGIAYNKTEIDQSLRYVLSVIKTNPANSNRSKNDQQGRIVINAGETKILSNTSINLAVESKVIILLLIYDLDNNIIGKDRKVLNDDTEEEIEEEESEKEELATQDVSTTNEDGVMLKGVVIEDTKTKPGRDFYSIFYSSYLTSQVNGDKIVTIKESLALGTNTKIAVLVGDEVVLEFFARPQESYLKSLSDVAIKRVNSHFLKLKKRKVVRKQY
jgi:hypothetical protein